MPQAKTWLVFNYEPSSSVINKPPQTLVVHTTLDAANSAAVAGIAGNSQAKRTVYEAVEELVVGLTPSTTAIV